MSTEKTNIINITSNVTQSRFAKLAWLGEQVLRKETLMFLGNEVMQFEK